MVGRPATLKRSQPSQFPNRSDGEAAWWLGMRVCMATHRRIDVSKLGDVTIIRFLDKKILDEAGILELGAELFGLVELENRKSLLLNFAGVEFLSSAALGKLITLDRKVRSNKGRMKMSNIRPEILEVFQITKLNKIFDIRKDEAEAISAFA
jgi:anti-sigma B factor antagonist